MLLAVLWAYILSFANCRDMDRKRHGVVGDGTPARIACPKANR